MKGYKVFDSNWKCRDFEYEVGETYEHNGPISLCSSGFHFCRNAVDCFAYKRFDPQNKVAEVEALGLVKSGDDKSVTDKIKIIREIPWTELLEIVNTGKSCTGLSNTGNWNVGNRNAGHRNAGDNNAGDWNAGDYNAGHYNAGDWNAGHYNAGDWNAGDWNTGHYNAGDWNAGDWNTGYFNTITPTISLFNKPTDMTRAQACSIPGIRALSQRYDNNWWIGSQNMSDAEKAAHPEHETLGGYLKSIPFKDACALMWGNMSGEEKQSVRDIPNFDAEIFEKITGIKAQMP